jgi:transposase
LPPNTAAELRRDMARLHLVREQIKALETARLLRLERASGKGGAIAMVGTLAQIVGVGIETADMLVHQHARCTRH